MNMNPACELLLDLLPRRRNLESRDIMGLSVRDSKSSTKF